MVIRVGLTVPVSAYQRHVILPVVVFECSERRGNIDFH